ncbi:M12 family metallo-peptidase [Paenibacillus sp. NFR01]|uniref:M12 family metallo-peptidase n=1 Tax=Paenibacillus sp. NFR01 TaxID=1566279 RepID=UPI0008AE47D2|nr:M12 family metallo-peptidase [Paenibacillus sp. NFR01]SEU19673.1 Metallo-peptidase family M12 [Paenibacillus sp. NFR01]
MIKISRASCVMCITFLLSMSLASNGFASSPQDELSGEVKAFYEKYAIDEDVPLYTGPQTRSFVQATPNIERTITAPVFDEKGNVIDQVTIEKNVQPSNAKSTAAAIGGKVCTVLVAVDEEYRAKHSDWQTLTAQIVEAADDAFNSQFEIDLTVTAYRYWFSEGSNSEQIRDNLRGAGTDNYDFVIGFTAEPDFTTNGTVVGGKAYIYTSAPTYAAYSVVNDQDYAANWHVAQHELSHNYSLEHDSEGPTPICIMNYGTMYSTTLWDAAHKTQLAAHKTWYGTNTN